MLGPSSIHAQSHPGMDGFQLPPKARGDFYFSQGKFKESLKIYKSILQDGADFGPIFRSMVKAWNANTASLTKIHPQFGMRWATCII